jgi:membrane protein CcdC involved in cytochrome C biogenesis
MKATLIGLVIVIAIIFLWLFSHLLAFFALAALFFVAVGIVIGWRINDWYEQTSFYRWYTNRRGQQNQNQQQRVAL